VFSAYAGGVIQYKKDVEGASRGQYGSRLFGFDESN
jgi:hypothetical protein